MVARLMPSGDDPVVPAPSSPVTIVVDGRTCTGEAGQTLAGVMLVSGVFPRRGPGSAMLCGIGVCFGCTATVDGVSDVRTCQRPAVAGTVVTTGEAEDA